MRNWVHRLALGAQLLWSLFVFGEALLIWIVVATDRDGYRTQALIHLPESSRAILFRHGEGMSSDSMSAFVSGMILARLIQWLPVAIPLGALAMFTKPRRA